MQVHLDTEDEQSASTLQAHKSNYPELDISLPLGSHLFHTFKVGGRELTSLQSCRTLGACLCLGQPPAAGEGKSLQLPGADMGSRAGGSALAASLVQGGSGLGGSHAHLVAHALI